MKDLRKQYIKKLFKVGWGKFSTDGFFLNGFQGEGKYKERWKNSQLYIYAFYKNGELNGEYRQWYDNGKLWTHTFYKNNRLDGEYKRWNHNNQLFIHKFYKDGKVVKDYLALKNNI